MKKQFILAASTSVALVGCVNDENEAVVVEYGQQLAFNSPVMTTQTRANFAGEITSDYPTDEEFTVFCRRYRGTFNGWSNSTESVSYFDENGETTSHNGSYWATDKAHTWPLSVYNLAFAAYSPSELNEGATASYGNDGLTIDGFETEKTSDDQYDLMYIDRVVDRNNGNNGNTAVVIKFKHALSSVVFSASKGENLKKEYKITNLKIVGSFHITGTFKQNITETAATDGTAYSETENPGWTYANENPSSITYTPVFDPFDVATTPNIFTGGASALLPIPQAVPEDAKLLVSFTKIEEGMEAVVYTDYEIPLKEFLIDGKTPITEWEMGHRYNYRIYFGGTPLIYFKPEVTQWVDGGVAQYTIQ